MTTLQIRPMLASDIPIAIAWAAAEGWNPGLNDAACFATVDTHGFLIGELDGKPAATISCVNYNSRFSFLGFYIVRQDLRGRGYGLQIWNEAIRHAGSRAIGLDGVVAQQRNYERSGFVHAYANVRFCGTLTAQQDMPDNVIDLSNVPLLQIEASEAMVFPAQRRAFLRSWIGAPGHIGRALIRDGDLAAWGVIRPCRIGYKIGPLVAFDRAAAESVLAALIDAIGGGEVFLDVPAVNVEAVGLANHLGLAPVFETARMYTAPIPPLRLERVFGVTTFELG